MNQLKSTTDWADDDIGKQIKKRFTDSIDALPPLEVVTGSDGIKTVTEYRIEDGKKLKIVRKIKVAKRREKVNHAVAERKKWQNFGIEKSKGLGPDIGSTTIGEDVPLRLEFGYDANKERPLKESSDIAKEKAQISSIKCRTCGGPHWTSKCPYKETLGAMEDLNLSSESVRSGNSIQNDRGVSSKSYVPPALRAGRDATSGESMFKRSGRNDEATLRVTNLSEYITEEELRQLFKNFGLIQRIYIARDRETKTANGFAFINFFDRDAAQRAIKKMDGFGFHNLIMRCEFSKPRD